MTFAEMFLTVVDGAALWLIICLSLIQLAPIKINPWSFLAKQIGKAINGDLVREVRDLRFEFDASLASQARNRILRFNDELLRKEHHSKEFFDNILEDIDAYEKYCDDHPKYKNSKAELAIFNIRRCYKKCEIEGDFLK